MSTRIPGLLTATAAISVAFTGAAAASAPSAAPPPVPAPPSANGLLAPYPSSGTSPSFGMNPGSDPAADANAAPRPKADPKPAEPEPGAAAPKAEPPKDRPQAEDGTDLKACEDAKCQVEIRDGQTITFDRRFGISALQVGIDGSRVTFTARGRIGRTTATLDTSSPITSATFNGVTLRPHRAENGAVILDISNNGAADKAAGASNGTVSSGSQHA
ncbi:hypothetical protein [Actinomadura sp. WMMA1423]|uniref:hypothetical protein n=1 Tax=Actinomadura sp. WMMA1423 TaxID=2591108 RepID=UPI0011477E5B|nr:hypothetical protein [Actinomadura sp. WMMA1423]